MDKTWAFYDKFGVTLGMIGMPFFLIRNISLVPGVLSYRVNIWSHRFIIIGFNRCLSVFIGFYRFMYLLVIQHSLLETISSLMICPIKSLSFWDPSQQRVP